MAAFNAMLFLSVLFVSVQVTISICCEDINADVKKKELAHITLCSTVTSELAKCCRTLGMEVEKQREAYKTLCPGLWIIISLH